jgi:hypothetical protein
MHTNAAVLSVSELQKVIRNLTQEELYTIIDKARYSFDANVRDVVDGIICKTA